MVFHISGSELASSLGGTALEFVKDLVIALAHDRREHVQAAAMRHSDDDFIYPECAAALDDLLKGRNRSLAAIKPEALRARITLVQESLEALGFDQLPEDCDLPLAREGHTFIGTLHTFLQPGLLCRIGDMHELDSEGRTVSAPQDVQHLARGGPLKAEVTVNVDFPVHVPGTEPVSHGIQLRLFAKTGKTKRVELCGEMPAEPEGADHHQGANGINNCPLQALLVEPRAFSPDLLADLLFKEWPVAVKGSDLLIPGRQGPAGPLPAGTFGILRAIIRSVPEVGEESPPALGHTRRVARIGCLHLLKPEGRSAIQKGSFQHGCITLAARRINRAAIICHYTSILPVLPPPATCTGADGPACLTTRQAIILAAPGTPTSRASAFSYPKGLSNPLALQQVSGQGAPGLG